MSLFKREQAEQRIELELFADYFQFYIQDENVSGDLSSSWTDEATSRLLAISNGVVGIGTLRNMDVPVTIAVSESRKDFDPNEYNQINECSIQIESGKLVVAGCTDYFPDAKRIKLSNGWYRVQIGYGNLDKVVDQLDGEDFYHVNMWREDKEGPVEILKNR